MLVRSPELKVQRKICLKFAFLWVKIRSSSRPASFSSSQPILLLALIDSRAKAPPAKINGKGYGDENEFKMATVPCPGKGMVFY